MATHTPGVIPLHLGMVKAFLIQEERPILVDTGSPGDEQKILSQLAQHGVAPQEIGLIILTHCHSDHIGSVAALKACTGAQVAIHESEADALFQGRNADLVPVGFVGRCFKLFIPKNPGVKGVKADLLLRHELDLTEFGIKGRVIATPGHTSGSVSIILESGAAIIGDLLRGGMFQGRVPHYPWFAHDISSVSASVRLVLNYRPTIIYTAHGGPFTPAEILGRFEEELR